MTELIDLKSAKQIFSRWFGGWVDVLDDLDRKAGLLAFKPGFGAYLSDSGHDSYPLLYLKLGQFKEAARHAMRAGLPAGTVVPGTDISIATPEERGALLIAALNELDDLDPLIGPHLTEDECGKARAFFATLDSDFAVLVEPLIQLLPPLFMVAFHEYLSVAVHGVPLSSLISRAMGGDDDAFGKAIQIDGRVLVGLPYFAGRYAQARLEADHDFLRIVSSKAASPGYRGRIRHKRIWLAIGLLDLLGLLDTLTGEQFLDFCDEVGINEGTIPLEDVKNALKIIATYRRYQTPHRKSTP